MSLGWIVQTTGNPRFPVRIAIEEDGRTLFAVRAQEAWPGAKGHIFCIRDGSSQEEQDLFKEIERVPVLSYDRFGRSIRLVLDRPTKKRCEFLILEKSYKNREGSYEQIFFKTQSASEAHKSRSRVALGTAKTTLTIVIDSAERYPWKFPKAQLERRKLPAGDYALVEGEKILAIVERKTFDNLLTDFSRIGPLHQVLEELSSFLSAEPEGLTLRELGEYLTDADTNRIRKSLSRLRSRGSVSCTSKGAKGRWMAKTG